MTKSKLIAALVTSTLFWMAPSGAFANTVDAYTIPSTAFIGPTGSISGSLTVDWTADTVKALSITTTAFPPDFPAATYTAGTVNGTTVDSFAGSSTLTLVFDSTFVLLFADELVQSCEVCTFSRDTATLDISPTTPIPAALPLFATGLGGLGLLGWRRKRKAQAVA